MYMQKTHMHAISADEKEVMSLEESKGIGRVRGLGGRGVKREM